MQRIMLNYTYAAVLLAMLSGNVVKMARFCECSIYCSIWYSIVVLFTRSNKEIALEEYTKI